MNINESLTLDYNCTGVIAARDAEDRLFDFYGIRAKDHYMPIPGLKIKMRITEIGSGPPVVVVPGNTGDVFPLIPLLASLKGRRIIAINRPGGGLSEGMDHRTVDIRKFAVQTITAVFDAFNLDSAPIIAHSMGGHWSLWMTMDNPHRVRALILLGVPGNVISTRPPLALRLMGVPLLNRLLFKLVSPRDTAHSLRGLSFMGHSAEIVAALPEAMADCYYHFQKLPHYKISAISLMEKGVPRITAEQLNTISRPVMLYWGTNDPFGNVETGREIAWFIHDAEFNAVKDAGHLPWLENPELCGRVALDFIAKY
jgi:2-hydroxy-6-oxonona-2,4-dienedioate hydrolase